MTTDAITEPFRTLPESADEETVGRLLEAYLTALESGEPIDRQAWLARFPQGSAELATMLEQLEALHRMATQKSAASTDGADLLDGPLATLGDYRIVREVGRGGMGVVYEAEQLSLGRRVALKVLPFAAMLDERQLTRFKNEARAAATLDHPHIVSVYAVGCERSVHFFAMQFIDGYSLAQVIVALRAQSRTRFVERSMPSEGGPSTVDPTDPTCDFSTSTASCRKSDGPRLLFTSSASRDTVAADALVTILSEQKASSVAHFRTIARLGIQAAEALQHAHERGVVHRDIKPANLMIDSTGKLWVADFGLARLDSDAGVTTTGDVVGTLRYMSPEQAQGKPAVVDHRTDIYSLGATLYELAAMHAPFDSDDRQTLMQRITTEEPASLKSQVSDIPRELETIILKALAKYPAERYATAQELADDLRRFIEDKPILARRPSLIDQATKWSRRHRGLVSGAVMVLLMTAIGSTVAAVRIEQSLVAETAERLRAEENLGIALAALDEVHVTLIEEVLPEQPTLSANDRSIIESVITHYEALVTANGDNPALRDKLADMYHKIGIGRSRLWMNAEAVEAYRKAIQLLDAMLEHSPDDPELKHRLGKVVRSCGHELWELTDPDNQRESLIFMQRAIDIHEGLVARNSADERFAEQLMLAYGNYGRYVSSDDFLHRAISIGRDLVGRFPRNGSYRSTLAKNLNNWALIKNRSGQEHGHALREALDVLAPVDILRSSNKQLFAEGLMHGAVRCSYARWLQTQNKDAEAALFFRDGIAVYERLLTVTRHEHHIHLQMLKAYEDLGILYETDFTPARIDEAVSCYRRLLEVGDDYQARHSNPFGETEIHALVQQTIGRLNKLGRVGVPEAVFRERIARWELLSRDLTADVEVRKAAVRAYVPITQYLSQQLGQDAEAEELWSKSIQLGKSVVNDFPEDAGARRMLAQRYWSLAVFLRQRGRPTEADAVLAQAAAEYDQIRTKWGTTLDSALGWARDFAELGGELNRQQQTTLGVTFYRHAVELGHAGIRTSLKRAKSESGGDAVGFMDVCSILELNISLAKVLEESHDKPAAKEVLRKSRESLALMQGNVPALPSANKLKHVLGSPPLRQAFIDVYEDARGDLLAKRKAAAKPLGLGAYSQVCFDLTFLLRHGEEATLEDEDRAIAVLEEAVAEFEDEQVFASLSDSDQATVAKLIAELVGQLCAHSSPARRKPARALELARTRQARLPELATRGSRTIAQSLFRDGQFAAAVEEYEKVFTSPPDAIHLVYWGMAEWQLGHHDSAIQRYEEGREKMEKATTAVPVCERRVQDEAEILMRPGLVQNYRKQFDAWLAEHRKTPSVEELREFAQICQGFADVLLNSPGATPEDEDHAIAVLEKVLAEYKRSSTPASLSKSDRYQLDQIMRTLAQGMSIHSNSKKRTPQRAMVLDQMRRQISPDFTQDASHTLAIALFSAGRWSEAVSAFEKKPTKMNTDQMLCWAMAHWHFGQKDEARKKYADGVARMKASTIVSGRSERLRAEAQALLQIDHGAEDTEVSVEEHVKSGGLPTNSH